MLPYVLFPDSVKSSLLEQGILLPEPKKNQEMTDLMAMRLAVQEAYRGLGYVSPNPLVGCVILDSRNRFLATGYHARVGEAHAEINALRKLNPEDLKDARVFVTLEPCAHEGRTGSCAKALGALPVKEVIYGLEDPNPLVSGKGADLIRDAGIKCTLFSGLRSELEQVCEHFLRNFRDKMPFISLKVASSWDGQMALKNGESKWITNETSREIAHLFRASHDAILVGANTLRVDQPSLNIRHPAFPNKKNKVVVLDSRGEMQKNFSSLSISKFHSREDLIFDQGRDLKKLLTNLYSQGIKSVLVEGGAQVLSSFINEMAGDRLYLFQAPMICGAKGGKSWSEQVNITSMSQRIAITSPQHVGLEGDILMTGKLKI